MPTRSIFVLLAPLLILGCATATKTFTTTGKEGYVINCSGGALNWGMCYEKAGDICGDRGYDVVQKSGDKGFLAGGTTYGFSAGSTISRTLIIQCKP